MIPADTQRPTILIVDDTPDNLALMSALLRVTCRTKVATGGKKALAIAAGEPQPDLILLDIMMPGMDGYEVCRRLKADPRTAGIPVIFLTARTDVEDEQRGFDVGGVDYIAKPVSPPIVSARVRTHLALKQAQDFLRDRNDFLEAEVRRRMREVSAVQDATILAMASLAETRDEETGNHIRRTQNYVRELALALRAHPRFSAYLTEARIELLYKSAPLHDIGKVGIPDRILRKPGRLDPAEFEIMKRHTTLGFEAIRAAEGMLGTPESFLACAREIARSHQEQWDGSGYPDGLAGEAIPIPARLMAVADVYDALISRRVYKPALPHELAVAEILAGRGSHFDPDVVDAFAALAERFREIALRYADPEGGEPAPATALDSALRRR